MHPWETDAATSERTVSALLGVWLVEEDAPDFCGSLTYLLDLEGSFSLLEIVTFLYVLQLRLWLVKICQISAAADSSGLHSRFGFSPLGRIRQVYPRCTRADVLFFLILELVDVALRSEGAESPFNKLQHSLTPGSRAMGAVRLSRRLRLASPALLVESPAC